MIKKRIYLTLLLFIFQACSETVKPEKPQVLKPGENMLKVNEIAFIHLELIAGNGYSWNAFNRNEQVLKVLGHKTSEIKISKNYEDDDITIGGKIMDIWKIKALKPGKVKLTFKYFRVWEGEKNSAKSIEFNLDIQE